ncbi:MAG: MaoC/PaaZ C-terminal domain-containing protein [Bacteroidota bacterium]
MFELNKQYDLGEKKFSEEEIIDFAMQYDPLDFHLGVEAGKKSIFKALISSGPHPFHYFYKNHWIPKFGKTVLAGIGVDNWRFLKPVFVNEKIHGNVTITELIPYPEKRSVTVRWRFEFTNEKSELCQHLEMLVLHKN